MQNTYRDSDSGSGTVKLYNNILILIFIVAFIYAAYLFLKWLYAALVNFFTALIAIIIFVLPYIFLIIFLSVVVYILYDLNRKHKEKERKIKENEQKRNQSVLRRKKEKENAQLKKAEICSNLFDFYDIPQTTTSNLTLEELKNLENQCKANARKREKEEKERNKELLEAEKKSRIDKAKERWFEDLDSDEQFLLNKRSKYMDEGYADIVNETDNELRQLRLEKQKKRLDHIKNNPSSYGKLEMDVDDDSYLSGDDKFYKNKIQLANNADSEYHAKFYEEEWKQVRAIQSKQRVEHSIPSHSGKDTDNTRRRFYNSLKDFSLNPLEKGQILEDYVQEIFKNSGYKVKKSKYMDKKGVDLEVISEGAIDDVFAVQCKNYPTWQFQTDELARYTYLIETGSKYSKLVIICPGGFSQSVHDMIAERTDYLHHIELWDYKTLEKKANAAKIPS